MFHNTFLARYHSTKNTAPAIMGSRGIEEYGRPGPSEGIRSALDSAMLISSEAQCAVAAAQLAVAAS
jgi:hypothetical protein